MTWGLIFFGLPFLAVGLGVMIWSGGMWWLYTRSQSWDRVPATILTVEFRTHRGDESTSYSVDCRYAYAVAGRAYEGTRVGLEGGGSSDGCHSRRYAILVRHRDSRTPFPAWVDPADPGQSLLFRELTTTLYILPVFGLVFALAGLAVSSAGLRTVVRSRLMRARLQRNPGRPWRASPRWQTFRIHDNPGRKIAGSLAMSVFTGLFISMFIVAIHGDANAPLFARIIIGLMALIPIGGLVTALYHALRYLKYGRASLFFRQLPFVMGQENGAILYVRRHLLASEGTELILTCIKKEWVRQGDGSSVVEREVYREKKTVTVDLAERTGRGSAVPVQFAVPDGKPETYTVEYPMFVWHLEARSATPGVDFSARFEIPVYNVTDPTLIDRNPLSGATDTH
jgi:hypothetical protein